MCLLFFFFFKQKTAYEMRISDWSSDVCSSDLWLVDAQLRLDGFRRQTDLPADQPTALIDPVTDIRRLDLIRVANCVFRRAEQIADRLTRRQAGACAAKSARRSEGHQSELQSLMSTYYYVVCLKKKTHNL